MSETTKEQPPKGKHGPRKKPEPIFVTKTEIANHLCVGDIQTLDAWIAEGSFPPPHSRPGQRFSVWLRKDWKQYVEGGRWPKEAWGRGGQGG